MAKIVGYLILFTMIAITIALFVFAKKQTAKSKTPEEKEENNKK